MSTKTTRLTRQMTAFMGAKSAGDGRADEAAGKSAGDECADEKSEGDERADEAAAATTATEQVRIGGLSDKRLSSCDIYGGWCLECVCEMRACIGLQTLAATKIQSVMRRYAHLRSRPAAREVREYIDSL